MTVDDPMDRGGRKNRKNRMSVAQRLQKNAQLSPRSQDDLDERESIVEMNIGKYDKATIRIIAQFLDNIGLQNSVEALVEETGFKIETSAGARIRANIVKGNYDAACSILEQARDLPIGISQNAAYIIQCFKLADLVRKGRLFDAVFTMQSMTANHLGDHSKNCDFFNSFVKDVMLGSNRYQHLDSRTVRESQLAYLEEILPSDFILPQNRLKTILHKVHGAPADDKAIKLLRDDAKCNSRTSPYHQKQAWDHQTPIYCVKFSRNGKMMASGGKSNQINVWSVEKGEIFRMCEMPPIAEGAIAYMEFCQQHRYLLVCGSPSCKYNLTIFDVHNRAVHRTLRVSNTHEEVIDIGSFFTCASFLTTPTSTRTRVVAGNELGALKVYDILLPENMHMIKQQGGFRVRCLHGMNNGDQFLAVDALNRVRMYTISSEKMEGTTILKEEVTIMNMVVHPSERLVLTVTDANLRLWDIRTHNLVRVFSGACQREEFNKFFIHTCFGGVHHSWIATGSIGKETEESLRENDKTKRANGRIILWSADESRPKHEIPGHKGHVNAVAWNPRDPTMLVSAGDDNTIRVFSINRSETSDYSEVIPRRIPRRQKRQMRNLAAADQPGTSGNSEGMTKELIRNLRDKLTTRTEFETDLKSERSWLEKSNRPAWKIDQEPTYYF
uniref:LisH domain-containing protein n=1 Tax=Caenorhabditis tropicalis TaxID=1561998 RepID=A0A1I7UB97_9PELO